MRFLRSALPGLLCASLAAAGAAGVPTPASASPSVRRTPPAAEQTGRVVVRYRADTSSATRSAAARAAAATVRAGIRALHVDVLSTNDVAGTISSLSARPDVVWAEPEVRVERHATEWNTTPERTEINVDGARAANALLTGAGVDVGVIDDGVFKGISDLPPSRLVDGGDCSGDECLATGGLNELGSPGFGSHGTAVAAIIAAEQNTTPEDNGEGINGVAPQATIHSYRVFPDIEFGTTDVSIANAILAAAADHMDVVNMSLGSGFDGRLMRDAMTQARSLSPNTLYVASSGNDGSDRPSYPAGDPYVLSVGGTQFSGGAWKLVDFSNRGDVDVLAPAVDIRTWDKPPGQTGAPTSVIPVDGTSFSAPMVSGIAAQLASAGVGLVGDRARAAIVASTEPANPASLSPPAPPAAHGVGRADALTAYNLAANGGATYTAVFVDRGEYVASQVGKRTLEILRVSPAGSFGAADTVGTGGVGTVALGASAAAAAPNNLTTARRTATYTAPTANPTDFTITASKAGDATSGVRPMRLTVNTAGPEGVPLGNNVAQSAVLTFGLQSSYIRTFPMAQDGCVDIGFTYPDASTDSLLFVWAPTTVNGVADSGDAPVGADDTEVSEGTYRYCATGRPAGTYAAGFVLFSPDGNAPGAFDPYRMTLHFPTMLSSLNVPPTSTNVSSTATFPFSWSSSTPGNRFDIQYTWRQRNAAGVYSIGAWRAWRVGLTGTSGTFGGSYPTGVPGTTYFLRVRARDADDKLGPWAPFKHSVMPVDDRYVYVKYGPGWSKTGGTGRYLGTLSVASAAGRFLTYDADTAGFTIIGDRCPTCGQLRVIVDGVTRAVIDTRAATTQVRQQLHYTGNFGSIGRHRLRLEVIGTPGRPRVALDGIAIIR